MLNKKILATAVALACSSSAFAAVDLDDNTNSQVVSVASESITSADVDTNGFVTVVNSGALDITVETGFGTSQNEKSVLRFDLTNAKFGTNLALAVAGVGAGDITLVSGGTGSDSVTYEITATAGVPQDAVVTLTADNYEVLNGSASTVKYALYEERSQSVAQTDALATADSDFATVQSVVTGVFTTPGTAEAQVATMFKEFSDAIPGDVNTAIIGEVTPDDVVKSGSIHIDGTDFDSEDVIANADADLVLTGDFSFGTFSFSQDDCVTTAPVVVDTDKAGATITANPNNGTDWQFCVTIASTGDDAAEKGSYSVTAPILLGTNQTATGVLGSIIYDTTTVEVPYLTTFSAYNQRLYLINRGERPALYTITYTTEGAATATAKAASTGTVPAGEVLALKATDIVDLTGRTRTAATVEIEAVASEVSVASQSVNLGDGSTDTVVHH